MREDFPNECLWHLRKSDGYMDLKMWDAARKELASIPEVTQSSTPCRLLALRLAMGEERWALAESIARELRSREPEEPAHWVQLAFVTRRLTSIERARSILKTAHEKFPAEPIIPFNLACYECQLGHRELARSYLAEAEALAPHCRELAVKDEDLRPLWDELKS